VNDDVEANKISKPKTVAKSENLKEAATVSSFYPLQKRADKIGRVIDEIIAHQDMERTREIEYKKNLETLSNSLYNLIIAQILIVLGSAAFSVLNLRRFFVKKHIF
jgi:hypothetical protein